MTCNQHSGQEQNHGRKSQTDPGHVPDEAEEFDDVTMSQFFKTKGKEFAVFSNVFRSCPIDCTIKMDDMTAPEKRHLDFPLLACWIIGYNPSHSM